MKFHSLFLAFVAQLVEQVAFNHLVVGSSPTERTWSMFLASYMTTLIKHYNFPKLDKDNLSFCTPVFKVVNFSKGNYMKKYSSTNKRSMEIHQKNLRKRRKEIKKEISQALLENKLFFIGMFFLVVCIVLYLYQ